MALERRCPLYRAETALKNAEYATKAGRCNYSADTTFLRWSETLSTDRREWVTARKSE